jgi:hypothetical protein
LGAHEIIQFRFKSDAVGKFSALTDNICIF